MENRITGTWCTLLLPLNTDDSIDFGKLEVQIDALIAFGVSGIYSNGTAAEFYSQSEVEFDQISELLAERCRANATPFQIGCNHVNPMLALERVKRAAALQPDAIQVILPDWTVPSMDEIVDFLMAVQQAANPIRLVLYNPPHAKRVLLPEEYGILRESGLRLAGCKVKGGDAAWYAAMRQSDPELSLGVPGHTLASGILAGADGSYSNIACLHPGAAQAWYHLMAVDMERALELEKRIGLFMEQLIRPYITRYQYSNQAVDKLMAAVGGWAPITTRLRWPYRGVHEREVGAVRIEAERIIPEFFPTN